MLMKKQPSEETVLKSTSQDKLNCALEGSKLLNFLLSKKKKGQNGAAIQYNWLIAVR